MGFQFSDRSQELQLRITKFLDDHIYPAEEVYAQQMQEFTEQGDRWQIPQIIEAVSYTHLTLPTKRIV